MKNFDYFDAFTRQASFGLQAGEFLDSALNTYNRSTLSTDLERMHEIENAADRVNHDVKANLRRDFVTPLERDDIAQFSQDLDEVVDAIEDVLMTFYMYHVPQVTDDMLAMSTALQRSARSLLAAVEVLPRFKKATEDILPVLISVNDAEEAGDRLFLAAMHDLHDPERDYTPVEMIAYGRVYERFENALDACEMAAARIEEIIMTNL